MQHQHPYQAQSLNCPWLQSPDCRSTTGFPSLVALLTIKLVSFAADNNNTSQSASQPVTIEGKTISIWWLRMMCWFVLDNITQNHHFDKKFISILIEGTIGSCSDTELLVDNSYWSPQPQPPPVSLLLHTWSPLSSSSRVQNWTGLLSQTSKNQDQQRSIAAYCGSVSHKICPNLWELLVFYILNLILVDSAYLGSIHIVWLFEGFMIYFLLTVQCWYNTDQTQWQDNRWYQRLRISQKLLLWWFTSCLALTESLRLIMNLQAV